MFSRTRMANVSALLIIGLFPVFFAATAVAGGNVLTAKKITRPPRLDAKVDSIWKKAKPHTITVVGGANLPGGTTDVKLRALYTSETVYFLVQYKDPTQSFRRSPWQRQSDGSWMKLKDPNDAGGDNNIYYEDKFGWIWDINTKGFARTGCMTACHPGEGKPFGNKYTQDKGERLDMWHLKSVRTIPVGQMDDQYVDSVRYDKVKSKNAGRHGDPKTGGGYVNNNTKDKSRPAYALRGNMPAPPYWILDAEKVPVDDSKYKKADEVPGIIVAPFTGDRGDISAKAAWKDGTWTIEIARKLVTGSRYDVQFDDLKKAYPFGVAVFNNTQVRHAYGTEVHVLKFK